MIKGWDGVMGGSRFKNNVGEIFLLLYIYILVTMYIYYTHIYIYLYIYMYIYTQCYFLSSDSQDM